MPEAAYPTGSDLSAAIEAQGFTAPDAATCTRHINRAIREWEQRTGYVPFLGATSATTYRFDPPAVGPLLLDGGFWTITAVNRGVTEDDAGTAMTLGSDYVLRPKNASLDDRGWDQIEFLVDVGTVPKSISVTGKRGYAEELPDGVWDAILDGAMAYALASVDGGALLAQKIKQGPVELDFGGSGGQTLIKSMADSFESAISRYERMVL